MRRNLKRPIAVAAGLTLGSLAAFASMAAERPAVDGAMVNRLIDAEFNHGQVVETVEYLADRIGGRMTNSPAMREAERWTQAQFKGWGLKNVHLEGFDFGRGWWIESAHARMVAPRPLELRSIPIAWTPATDGPLTAAIVVAPMKTEKDFAQWRGKLAGKIVLTSWPAPPKDETEVPFQRLSESDISKLNRFQPPTFDPDADKRRLERFLFGFKLDAFLASEGALASVRMSRIDGHLIHGEGYAYQRGRTPKLPAIELAAEDYRKLARLAKSGEVRLEIDNRVHFEDSDPKAYNVFAEIPGRDAKAGFVMAGAHLDSWVAADGAADNGAGSAVVMEAARLLASLHLQTKRTIRFALWSGEEQGLLGSAAYVQTHLARRPESTDPDLKALGPYFATQNAYPVTELPEAAQLAGYFNIDNGSGRIRGIYAEGNFGAAPILREWLAPLASLGASSVVTEPTYGTDHVLMERVGLPGFQFIQDPLDYESRVHHTDVDTFDHLRSEDLRQAVVVLAAMLLDAADAAEPLPVKPVPTPPRVTDPFAYPDPAAP